VGREEELAADVDGITPPEAPPGSTTYTNSPEDHRTLALAYSVPALGFAAVSALVATHGGPAPETIIKAGIPLVIGAPFAYAAFKEGKYSWRLYKRQRMPEQ